MSAAAWHGVNSASFQSSRSSWTRVVKTLFVQTRLEAEFHFCQLAVCLLLISFLLRLPLKSVWTKRQDTFDWNLFLHLHVCWLLHRLPQTPFFSCPIMPIFSVHFLFIVLGFAATLIFTIYPTGMGFYIEDAARLTGVTPFFFTERSNREAFFNIFNTWNNSWMTGLGGETGLDELTIGYDLGLWRHA